ncbi:MAG: calcium/sodium antiporter [Deltaproteobacteria bacterium]|nr:calcium/sodium antiporter [Deltaproteobacteria bacterium]
MILAWLAVVGGLILLIWSADRFVEGAALVARHFGMPPLLIGMVIVGFGTSAPEMVVSAISAFQGNPGLALGNAYGSNIANIALILGLTALIAPIQVHSKILRKELPVLMLLTCLAGWQLSDSSLSRPEALFLLLVFAGLMGWVIFQGIRQKTDSFGAEIDLDLGANKMSIQRAFARLLLGLALLILSSRMLVWGAVAIAQSLGVSDLVIGLTVVAIGTSLPELASSLAATRKGEHDIALGNILGSNVFNTLAVVGIAGVIAPMSIDPQVFTRDLSVMALLTLSLFIFGYGFRRQGRINRGEGGILLSVYIGYTFYLIRTTLAGV